MKHLNILILLLCNFLFSQLKLGFDINGEAKVSASGDSQTVDIDNSVILGYERILEIDENLTYGLGGEFMINRGAEEFATGNFAFHSIYGYGNYKIDEKLYGIGRIGYNLFTGDDDFTDCSDFCEVTLEGGLMYGLGFGFSLTQKVDFEGMYITNEGKVKLNYDNNYYYGIDDTDAKFSYSRLNLALKMKL